MEISNIILEKGYVYFVKLAGQNMFQIGKSKKDPIFLKPEIEADLDTKVYIHNWMKINNYSIIESEIKQAFKKYLNKEGWFQFPRYALTDKGKVICLEIKDAISTYSQTDEECVLYKSE